MRKVIITLMILCFSFSTAYAVRMDNHERVFQQTQTFQKPVQEQDSKTGVWADAPNVGLIDPVKAFYLLDDFIDVTYNTTADANTWYVVGENCTLQDDAPGGEIWLTTAATTNAVVNLQANGESFRLTGGNKIWYETSFNLVDVSEADWFAGLAITDTTVMAGITDRIGFECPDYTGDVDFIIERNTIEHNIDTGFNLTDATNVRLGFVVDNSGTQEGNVSIYVNDSYISLSSTVIPYDEALTPTFEVKASGSGGLLSVAEAIEIDYVKCLQER